MSKIILAKTAGFCFGVSRAVSMVEEKAKEGAVYTYGPVIHNDLEIKRLEKLGARVIKSVDEVKKGDRVIIRSHGVSEAEERALMERGAEVFDATCPFVKKIHEIVSEYSKKGYTIVIFGDKGHPEVSGIEGRCGGRTIVLSDEDDINEIPEEKLCVVAQTTANKDKYNKFIKNIKNACKSMVFFDTICCATQKRQDEVYKLSCECDSVIVIGDKKSRNTLKLYEVASENCSSVYHIENAEELDHLKLAGKIGITAGASAPDWIIKEVLKTMEENALDKGTSFVDELEKSLITLNTGDVVKGTVIGITPTEVYVDLGYKADGVIDASEIFDDPAAVPEDVLKVGDEIEAYVYRVSDVEGTVGLSIKRIKNIKEWENIQKAFEEKQNIKAKIVEAVNGGVIATTNGVRIFIPATLANDRYLKDLSVLVGKEVPVRIREINRGRKKIIGSIKDVLVEERAKQTAEFWEKVDAGQKEFEGVVKTITNFGAFIDIGGVDGLAHISELSWTHIKHPSEVLNVGDKVNVILIEADRETGKVSLGYRRPEENPWEIAKTKLHVGDVVSCKIVRLVHFGAFAEILPGIDGLIHISQIADRRIEKPSDELSVGQVVEAKITDINWEDKKIALSIRALIEPAVADAVEEAQPSAEEPEVSAEATETPETEEIQDSVEEMAETPIAEEIETPADEKAEEPAAEEPEVSADAAETPETEETQDSAEEMTETPVAEEAAKASDEEESQAPAEDAKETSDTEEQDTPKEESKDEE